MKTWSSTMRMCALVIKFDRRLLGLFFGEGERKLGAGAVATFQLPAQLLGQHADKLKADGLDIIGLQIFGDADAVVVEAEAYGAIGLRLQLNEDLSRPAIGKGVFEGIG